ncbi:MULTISPECIES: alpha/beta hydrolase [Prauserella salsuginis group]|uniref:Pimeloyl-ACP methyl ester carboxylesterase n=2 Tax=Prauserella salsuginis group TaxID=2893672 RepID=A0A839XG81_9PSEU|nr:pimeloyl-ACP methyl ester carboxylesterase [Prauserella sediminis]MCR3722852.1 alpha/beta hydrolase fold [Prauserella flava]MCR3737093.1 alpha/beta hydrolase fold [Prauserella salsuginis]
MPSVERYLALATCVLALGGLTTACSSDQPEQKGPVGPVPQGLDRFYGQALDWGECEPYATSEMARSSFGAEGLECARLTVPLDYDEPDGPEIELGLLRHRATGDDRIGSLVVNPGGPGASGMLSAASMAGPTADTEIGQRFDLVGFDPRGVGASEPALECLTDNERDADRADDVEYDGSRQGVRATEEEERRFAAKCAERTEHGEDMLAHLGTRDVVQDMDVLRSVLGDRKLNYVGYSYGTRIGYTYAERFPRNVRSLVLDGALDPEQDSVESLVSQGEGFGKSFEEFAAWCQERSGCPLTGDPTKAYQDLVRPLLDDPVDVGGRVLSYDDATTGTIQALYSERMWPQLKSGLAELSQGSGSTLMALADMYNERDSSGNYANTQDAFVAIRCVDDPPVEDREKIRDAQRRYAEVAPFLDPGTRPSAARDACAFWPVDSTSEPHLPDVDGVPPALVVSTTNDPATPYRAGVQLAKALDGRLLTFEGNQHTVFLQGNQCVDGAGARYLIDGTLPQEGKRCG